MERRLAAILAADVVGYSRMIRADENGTIAALRELRQSLIDPKIEQHRGRIFKTTGDGFLIEFASAVDAVQFGSQLQLAVHDNNAAKPKERQIVFRVGINLGDVIIDDDDIQGDGVNVAARLEGLAVPGGICLADSVYEQVRDRVDLDFEDLGGQEVKNIDRPVRAWKWQAAGQGSVVDSPDDPDSPPLPSSPSIAVLPFDNMSGDPDQEYFADGMSEDIITSLSRIDMLFVIARNSSFTYKGRAVDIRDVSRELGVRYVLEGSVRRSGNRVRITAQLIEAQSGNHLWADKFDGLVEDVFDLQDRITEAVVGAIEPTLWAAEAERSKRKRPENLDAYDLLMRATPHAFAFRADDNRQAIDLLSQAIEKEPGLASALAYKAWCIAQIRASGWPGSDNENHEEAVSLARRAISADDQNAGALATAGFILVVLAKDYPAGLAAVRRALKINGNSAYVCMHAGYAEHYDGQSDKAIELLERSLRLSPVDPLSYHIVGGIAAAHLTAGRLEQAHLHASQSFAENSEWTPNIRILASACGHLGYEEECQRLIDLLLEKDPTTSICRLREWMPYRDPRGLNYFLDGLRKAGMPEG